ncbi:MAG: ribosome maturation factor RimP [Rhizobiaceae bacterium]|nr:ribosome maturation factor RimP [Rhizobiaceae bacterium]
MLEDDRIIRETGLEARIYGVVAPVAADLGMRVVRIKISGRNGMTLQIMAERTDGTMSVNDCEVLSNAVSPALDVEDLIERAYHLEISSPGIDRPLTRAIDFGAWGGYLAKVQTGTVIAGRKRFTGFLGPVTETGFTLLPAPKDGGGTEPVDLPFDAITDANLVLTDALIDEALKRDKAARKARGEPDDGQGDDGNSIDAANDNSQPDD